MGKFMPKLSNIIVNEKKKPGTVKLMIYPSIENFNFTDKQKEKMLSFGNSALIILDSDEFARWVMI